MLRIGQDTWHLSLQVKVGSSTNTAKHARGEHTYIGKNLRVAQTDVKRLATTHGETAHGATFAVFSDTVGLLHKRYHILQQLAAESLHALPTVTATETAVTRTDVTVGAYHNHRRCLACGNQVVHNLSGATLLHPSAMVLAATVLDIDHWIVILVFLIACGGVDHQWAPRLVNLGIIIHSVHFAMGHIFHLEVFHACLGDVDGARPTAATKERLASGVGYRHTVDNQEIIVEPWHLGLGGHCPRATFGFRHVILGPAQVYLHALCLWRIHAEHHAVV